MLIEGIDWTQEPPRKLSYGDGAVVQVFYYAILSESEREEHAGYRYQGGLAPDVVAELAEARRAGTSKETIRRLGAQGRMTYDVVVIAAMAIVGWDQPDGTRYVELWQFDPEGDFIPCHDSWMPDVATAREQYPDLDWKQP